MKKFTRVSPSKLNTPLAKEAKGIWKVVSKKLRPVDVINAANLKAGQRDATYVLFGEFSYWLEGNTTIANGLWQFENRSYRSGAMLNKYLELVGSSREEASHEFVSTALGEALTALSSDVYIGRWGGEYIKEAYSMAKLGSCMYGKTDAADFYRKMNLDIAMLWVQNNDSKAKFRGRALLWGDKAMDRPYPNSSEDPVTKVFAETLIDWALFQGLAVRGPNLGDRFQDKIVWEVKNLSYDDVSAWPYFDTLSVSAEIDNNMVFSSDPIARDKPFRGAWAATNSYIDGGVPIVKEAQYCAITNKYFLGISFSNYLDGKVMKKGVHTAVERLPFCANCNSRYRGGKGKYCDRCESQYVKLSYLAYKYSANGFFVFEPYKNSTSHSLAMRSIANLAPERGYPSFIERVEEYQPKSLCVEAVTISGNKLWLKRNHAYVSPSGEYYAYVPSEYTVYKDKRSIYPSGQAYVMAYNGNEESALRPLSEVYLLAGVDRVDYYVTKDFLAYASLPTTYENARPFYAAYETEAQPYKGIIIYFPRRPTVRVAVPLSPQSPNIGEWAIIDPELGLLEVRYLEGKKTPTDVPALFWGRIGFFDLQEAERFYSQSA